MSQVAKSDEGARLSSGVQQYKGLPIPRIGDTKLMNGSAKFAGDHSLPGLVYCAIFRSTYAHARITRLDVARAEKLPGVLTIITGQDAKRLSKPLSPPQVSRWGDLLTAEEEREAHRSGLAARLANRSKFKEFCLAVDKVIFQGQPVAAVAASDEYVARDALDYIDVEYEPLPVVVDPESGAKPGAPILYEDAGTNIVFHDHLVYGDVKSAFASAHVTTSEELVFPRYSSTPIEKWACICAYDPELNRLTVWSNHQNPMLLLVDLPKALDIPASNIHLIVPEIGGSYGNKQNVPDALVVALLAMKSGRAVKYTQTEREMMMAQGHACNGRFYAEAAADGDGIVTALRIKEFLDEGARFKTAGLHVTTKLSCANGCYKIPNLEYEAYSVLTNKCPSVPNRAVGKPAMSFVVERLMDSLARKMDMDRAEIRYRNFIQPSEFPYVTVTGNVYDSGDYPNALKLALERVDYDRLRQEQAELRKRGRYLGIGIATVVVSSVAFNPRGGQSLPSEIATVRLDISGKVVVSMGSPGTGQGHSTTVAQIVADELGVPPEEVQLLSAFDTDTHAFTSYSGRYSNKFSTVDSLAVLAAAREVRLKVLRVAAHLLRREQKEMALSNRKAFAMDDPSRSVSLEEILRNIHGAGGTLLPEALREPLTSTCQYISPYHKLPDGDMKFRSHGTFANAAHVPVVEVDTETGRVEILKYVAVEDCGSVINPLIVEGQIHGAMLHGISAALGEEFMYDGEGQLLTATFMDYQKPTTVEAPKVEVLSMQSASPLSPLGAKGVGDGGAVPPLAALASAVEDALSPFGIQVTQLPLTPERVLRMLREKRDASSRRRGATLRNK